MTFLNPTYLWALLGLAIPIAIHLWNKKEGKTIKVGSIELFKASEAKQTNSIKLNEMVLLALRLLTIALLVFILAEPQFKGKLDNESVVYMVEPMLTKNNKIKTIIDSLESTGPVYILAQGIPEYNNDEYDETDYNSYSYWQLAKQMESLPADSIVVFTKGLVSHTKGKRPQVNKRISWVVLDEQSKTLKNTPLVASTSQDSVEVIIAQTNENQFKLTKERYAQNSNKITINSSKDSVTFLELDEAKQIALISKDPLNILINYQNAFDSDKKYIEASFRAISKHLKRELSVTVQEDYSETSIENFNAIVWLSEEAVPQTAATLIVYNPDLFANAIIEKSNAPNLFYLRKHLNSENIIDEHFTEQLLEVLDLDRLDETTLKRIDERVVAQDELKTNYSEKREIQVEAAMFPISKWFWLALILVIFSERVIASYRKQ